MNGRLVPEFFNKFKCIGSTCENTCCGGWGIVIDKSTYKKYKKIRTKEFKELIKNSIEINPTSSNHRNFARMKLNEKKQCKFLDKNKLCIIHKEFGEKALCDTCKEYPKVYNKVGDLIETSLTLSCPEAARLALLNPNKMEFENLEIKNNFLYYPGKIISKNEELFWKVRIFNIDLIQNRKFKIWQRLIILGLFFEEANEPIKNNDVEKVLSIINSFKSLQEEDNIDDLLNDFKINSSFQLSMIKIVNDVRLSNSSIDLVLKDCIDDFNKGLDIEGDLTEKQFELYKSNYTNHYAKYMNEHEYIMENYLTNYVFTNLFPFQYDSKDSFDEYSIMVLNYALIKAYLIGISGASKSIDEAVIIKLIHSLEKSYRHGNRSIEHVFDELKRSGKIDMKDIPLLLRN